MIRSFLCMSLMVCLFVGCSTTYQVGESTGDMSSGEAADKLIGEEVKIITTRGETHKGVVQHLTSEALIFRAAVSDSTVRMPLPLVRRVEEPPSRSAIAGGALGGIVFGGLVGALIAGAASAADEDEDPVEEVLEPYAAIPLGALAGALAGGALGLVIGLNSGRTYEFSYKSTQPDSVARVRLEGVRKQ